MVKKRILLVDDEKKIVDVFQKLLTSYGFIVKCAPDGSKALDLIKENKFDLLITDIHMKPTSGIQLLKKIPSELPVLVVTGDSTMLDRIKPLPINLIGFLLKPVDVALLLKIVKKTPYKSLSRV